MDTHIPTVRGPISPADLGRVLMHEHIFILTYDYLLNYPDREGFDEDREIAAAIASLNDLKRSGIDTIVDLTVMNMGRFIPRIQRVAAETDLHLVVATGLYIYQSLPMPFHYQGPGTVLGGPELLVDMFVGDIVDGIAGTGVKAGMIKCATDEPGMVPDVERVVRACARTAVVTGTPITTHTHAASRVGNDQLRVFEEEGVDLERVVIGHSGDTKDIDYLVGIMARGACVGMDRFGTETPLSTAERIAVVAELCRQGFSEQIVLSHDAAVFNDFTPMSVVREAAPNWTFRFIPTVVEDGLRAAGVSEQMLSHMLINNPRRILSHPQTATSTKE